MPSICFGPIILVRVLLVHGCIHGKPVFLERQHKLKKQLPSMHGGGAPVSYTHLTLPTTPYV